MVFLVLCGCFLGIFVSFYELQAWFAALIVFRWLSARLSASCLCVYPPASTKTHGVPCCMHLLKTFWSRFFSVSWDISGYGSTPALYNTRSVVSHSMKWSSVVSTSVMYSSSVVDIVMWWVSSAS